MRRHVRSLVAAVAGLVLQHAAARAQNVLLESRLTPATAAAVRLVIDSATRTADLPNATLVDRALEAKAKGASDAAIVAAVRRYSRDLASARAALGSNATPVELEAGASVLEAGVSTRDLARVRTAAPRRPLSRPLLVLADLVAQRVPVATSVNLMVTLLRSGVGDIELRTFEEGLRADIARGVDPTTAANARAQGAMGGHGRYIPTLAY